MRYQDAYPELYQFLAGGFNQDAVCESSEAEIIEEQTALQSAPAVRQALSELRAFLQLPLTEAELRECLLDGFRSYYAPENMTYRAWLEHLARLMEEQLAHQADS